MQTIAEIARPRLAAGNGLQFSKYEAPIYPAIAKAARVEGKVELELAFEPVTGTVSSVSVVSGHPMLRNAAVDAAKHWIVSEGTARSEGARIVLDFAFRCPKDVPLKFHPTVNY